MSRSKKKAAKPKLTPAQRSEINKANGACNQGTQDPDLKRKVSRNALKHGLCAQNIEVLIPDADEREARRAVWVDKYQPEGPDEESFVEEAVIAEYKLVVAANAHEMIVNTQLQRHRNGWDDGQLDRRDDLVKRFETADAPKVLRELATFAAGAEWVRDAWRDLDVAFRADPHWETYDQVEQLVRLSGYDPDALDRAPVEGFVRFLTAWSCLDDDEWVKDLDARKAVFDAMPAVWMSASWSINPAKSGRTAAQVEADLAPRRVEAAVAAGPEPDPATLPWWLKGDTPEERAMKRAARGGTGGDAA